MTQGLITMVNGDVVVMNVIAGSNGQNIRKVTQELRKQWPMTIDEVYALAILKEFGTEDSLVVMTADSILFEGDEELSLSYATSFNQKNHNPRWEHGTADHAEIVDVSI